MSCMHACKRCHGAPGSLVGKSRCFLCLFCREMKRLSLPELFGSSAAQRGCVSLEEEQIEQD